MADVWIELHVALGLVVTAGAKLEDTLRLCFCMLDGGENADVVAAEPGRNLAPRVSARYLAKASPSMDQVREVAVTRALAHCKAASEARNELIHGLHNWPGYSNPKAVGSGWIQRSRRHKPVLVKNWTIKAIRDVWLDLDETSTELRWTVAWAVGPLIADYWERKVPNWVDEQGQPWPF